MYPKAQSRTGNCYKAPSVSARYTAVLYLIGAITAGRLSASDFFESSEVSAVPTRVWEGWIDSQLVQGSIGTLKSSYSHL